MASENEIKIRKKDDRLTMQVKRKTPVKDVISRLKMLKNIKVENASINIK